MIFELSSADHGKTNNFLGAFPRNRIIPAAKRSRQTAAVWAEKVEKVEAAMQDKVETEAKLLTFREEVKRVKEAMEGMQEEIDRLNAELRQQEELQQEHVDEQLAAQHAELVAALKEMTARRSSALSHVSITWVHN